MDDCSKSVLVVEDDPSISNMLRLVLGAHGYKVISTGSGIAGLAAFRTEHPDLVLLDLGLPDVEGMEILSQVRADGDTPVIVVSARDQERQKVEALEQGADDYVVKPFGIDELYARVKVALRHHEAKASQAGPEPFEMGDLKIDFERRQVSIRGSVVHFTPIEYRILAVLIDKRGKVLTHRYLQDAVWGYPTNDEYQSLRVHMASIRRKLEDDPAMPRYITTEVGVGYRFSDE